MTTRRIGFAAAAVLAVAVLLVVVGRWEATRHADEQNEAMARVLSEIGPLDQQELSGYRRLTIFDCLTYRRGQNPFALELCVNAAGRVIETMDRRMGDAEVWSLREDPGRATNVVDRALVDRLLERMNAPDVPIG